MQGIETGTLTKKQLQVLGFLRSYTNKHGYPPTMRDIGENFGFSWPAAKGYLTALAKKGFIRVSPNKSRGIEILDRNTAQSRGHSRSQSQSRGNALELPVAGRIRAGKPALAQEDLQGKILIDKDLFGDEGSFVLKAEGDSMVEAGILNGDFVVVRPQGQITNGDIGVVLIGEEATVKKVYLKGDTVTLAPCNSAMQPIKYPADKVSVIGKVIGIIRKM